MCIDRNTTHGMSKTRTYKIWDQLGNRRYECGGICERWRRFENFFEDMGECPPDYTLHRVNNARGYEPSNCVWADWITQQNNRTNNRRLTHDGETMTLSEWSRRTGIRRECIAARIDRLGWPVDKALTTPTR